MKRIKIVAIALFTLATIVNVNAQDSNNPWAVSAGINSWMFMEEANFSMIG